MQVPFQVNKCTSVVLDGVKQAYSHSLAKMVRVVLVKIPNADLECLSSLACEISLTLLAAHQLTNFTNGLAIYRT